MEIGEIVLAWLCDNNGEILDDTPIEKVKVEELLNGEDYPESGKNSILFKSDGKIYDFYGKA